MFDDVPALTGATPPRRRRITQWVGFVLLVLIAGTAAVVGWDVVGDAWTDMGAVSAASWSTLGGVWVLWTGLRAMVQEWSIASMDVRTALMMSEAGEAANWLPVGALGSFAIRTSLGRSRCQATGAFVRSHQRSARDGPLAARRSRCVDRCSTRDCRRARPSWSDRCGYRIDGHHHWRMGHRGADPGHLLARRTALRAQARIAQRWTRAGSVDLGAAIEEARRDSAGVIRRRAVGLVAANVAVYLASGTILSLALRAVGGANSWMSILVVYLPVKAAVGFSPTPGGVGFTEAGLAGALVATGVPVGRAVAGVAIYRLFTALMPLVSGSAIGV